MRLMELNARTANGYPLATVKVKVTGPVDADGCVEVTCVETITEGMEQVIIFSDEKGA